MKIKLPVIIVGIAFLVAAVLAVYPWLSPTMFDSSPKTQSDSVQIPLSQKKGVGQEEAGTGEYQKSSVLSEKVIVKNRDTSLPRLRDIYSLPTPDVYQALIDGSKDGEDDRLNIATGVLKKRARAGDGDVVRLIVQGVERGDKDRVALIYFLGEIETADSVEALLRMAVSGSSNRDIRDVTLNGIERAGLLKDDGTYNEEVSPVLERYLDQTQHDPEMLSAIAMGISTVGSEEGIVRLLEEMRRVSTSEERDVIAQAMTNIINDHAIPPLARELAIDPNLSRDEARAAGGALANIGGVATKELLKWAAQLDDRGVQEQALIWLKKTQDSDLMIHASSSYHFKDPTFGKRIEALAVELEPVITVTHGDVGTDE